jgi:hypothetical protein
MANAAAKKAAAGKFGFAKATYVGLLMAYISDISTFLLSQQGKLLLRLTNPLLLR